MLDTEGQWSEALASNNIRAIIRWLRKLRAEGILEAFDHYTSVEVVVVSTACKNTHLQ